MPSNTRSVAPISADLKAIAQEWDRTGEELMTRRGIVDGTQAFLSHVLGDDRFKDHIAIVSSFGTEAALPLALIADINPHVPVILVDTGYLFDETFAYMRQLRERIGLTDLRVAGPTRTELASVNPSETCCDVIKKEASLRALKDFSAWFSGRKRYQGAERAALPVAEFAEGKVKLNLMALWTATDIENEFARRNLPQHPLKAQGYGSVGCWPCTAPGGPDRSGRWPGAAKTECGLHLDGSGI